MPKIFRRFATFLPRTVLLGALLLVSLPRVAGAVDVSATQSIQDAINACPKSGCEIVLTDSAYKLPRELWIEGMMNFTLRRSDALERRGVRPRLYFGTATTQATLWTGFAGTAANPGNTTEQPTGWKTWPKNDGTLPGGAKNTTNQWSTSGFQNIGYIVVKKSEYVTIDGIQIDGQMPTHLLNRNIWPETPGGAGKYGIFFGNTGINLMQALKVTVRNSEIRNCVNAIYMNGRNPGGAFGVENPGDLDGKNIIPYSNFGRVGDHTIERNIIRDNWWAFFDESEWDLGSTIRYNISYNNYNSSYATIKGLDLEGANMIGGFMYIKDVVLVPHKIYNNTMYKNAMILGYGGWRGGIQHYFFNNIVAQSIDTLGGLAVWNDFRNLLQKYSTFLYTNTFELGKGAIGGYQDAGIELKGPDSIVQGTGSAFWCNQTWCNLNGMTKRIINNIQVNGWQLEKASNTDPKTWFEITYNGKLDTARVGQQSYMDSVGRIMTSQGVGTTDINIANHENHFVLKMPFKSTVPGAAGFMEPVWDTRFVDSAVEDKGWDFAGRDPDGTIADRGAIPRNKGVAKSQIVVHDQTKVSVLTAGGKPTVEITFGLDALGMTDLRWDKLDYYPYVAYVLKEGTANAKRDLPDRNFPVPQKMTVTSGAPVDGQNSFKASLPVAPADSFARFEITVSGIPAGGTERVTSNIGVWVWRQANYDLEITFIDPTTNLPTTAVRVGQPVKMRVRARKTKDGTYPTLDVDSLIVSLGSQMMKGIPPAGDSVRSGKVFDSKVTGGSETYDVYFTRVEKSRVIDLNLSGKLGSEYLIGSAALRIKSGPAEKAIFVDPTRYASDRTKPTILNQTPTQLEVALFDAWDNPVDDEAVPVEMASIATQPEFLVKPRWGTTSNGPWNTTAEVISDSLGYALAHPFHYVVGKEGERYYLTAKVKGKPFVDTAWVEVGPPVEQLYFQQNTTWDTLIKARMPARILLSKDGQAVATASDLRNSHVMLGTVSGSTQFKFYASAAATDTIPLDSVALVNGEVTVYVTVNSITTGVRVVDTLSADLPALFAPAPARSGEVVFRRPPVPPNPVPEKAGVYDFDCDGIGDSLFIQLKSPGQGAPAKLSSKTRLDTIFVTYGSQTYPVTGNAWRFPGGDSSIIHLAMPGTVPANSALTGKVRLALMLVNPPASDSPVVTPEINFDDRIGPRLLDTAVMIENFGRPAVDDSIVLTFSEPVRFDASTGWAFTVTNAGGVAQPSAGLTVKSVIPNASDARFYTVVFAGNTAGSLVKGGYRIRINPSSTLVDLAGNAAGGTECAPGVPVVERPRPAPFKAAWIKDRDGDGRADQVVIQFEKPSNRSIRESDVPQSVRIDWARATDTATVSQSTFVANADSTVFTMNIGPFTLGATAASGANGAGTIGLRGTGRNGENHALIDSVLPIPTAAKLTYGPTYDTLVVTYSEALEKSSNGATIAFMERIAGAGHENMELVEQNVEASGTVWTFLIAPNAVGYAQPGDSIRLPKASSKLIAVNNDVQPSSTSLAPWVLVMGGDRSPRQAWYYDGDGNGIADKVGLVFARPLKTSPTFTFRIGDESVSVKEGAGLEIDADRLGATVDLTAGTGSFTKVVTLVHASDSLGAMSSSLDGITVVSQKFPVLDSIDPVILSGHVAYAGYVGPGEFDTLRLKFSEPVRIDDGSSVVAGSIKNGGATAPILWDDAHSGTKPKFVSITSDSILVFCDTSCVDQAGVKAALPGRGDSIRIASLAMEGVITDESGNRPEDVAKWTVITAGDRPLAFNVSIYPQGVHFQGAIKDPAIKALPSLTAWAINSMGSSFDQIANGGKTGVTMDSMTMARNGLGLRIDLNSPLHANVLIYDKLGVFVGQERIDIDSATLKALGIADNSGKYSVLIFFNGTKEKNEVGSGVYLVRFVTYHEELLPDMTRQPRLHENKLFTLGWGGNK